MKTAFFSGGTPPGPHAGNMSRLTRVLRPPLGLTPEQCREARQLRRAGHGIADIVAAIGATEESIRQALAAMRTRKRDATRRSLNVTLAAHEFVAGQADEREPLWQTVDRLLMELAMRRVLAGAPITRDRAAER
jgi:hypothetical protein